MTAPAGPSGQKWPAEVLTPDEIQALINACSAKAPTGIRNRALMALLYRSGLRISEAIGYPGRDEQKITLPDGREKIQPARDPIPPLRVSNIDLAARSIRLLETKSSEAQTARLHPSAVDAVARWLDVRRQLGLNGRQPAFCTLKGGPLREQYVRTLLGRLADEKHADLAKRVHPHAFRHTYAVELERAGTPVSVISMLLRHSSIAVTARYLAHLTNAQAGAVLDSTDLPPIEY
jgi:integrase/recombinase XerD